MLAADHVIGSMVDILGMNQKIHDVSFTVSHVDLPGLRQLHGRVRPPARMLRPSAGFP